MSDTIKTTVSSFVLGSPMRTMAFGALNDEAVPVSDTAPLPVMQTYPVATSVPVSGTATSSGVSGTFSPAMGLPIWLRISGTWTGNVALERSDDDGVTWFAATLYTGDALAWAQNVNAPVTEETVSGAQYRLNMSVSSGTIVYEIRQ